MFFIGRYSPLLIILALTCTFFTACPKRPTERPPPKVPHDRPPVIRPDDTTTPERAAADERIQKGIIALKEDEDPERAEGYFQEAIRIAPSYGPAYYWLARAKYELDELTRAWDLLDRATLLIGHESVWLERIDELRAAISDAGQ